MAGTPIPRATRHPQRGSWAVAAWAALLALAALAGCSGGSDAVPAGTGIEGRAMMGPTCPVERDPPDPACAPRPYEGVLDVVDQSGRKAASVRTGPDGSFRHELAPGTYTMRQAASEQLPSCAAGPFDVVAGAYTQVTVDCDTGIR